uniref:Homeobox domain-containing protein n=1 Tax=Chloebia gouldiae TaxID=44316 RepID=A0A3L8R1N6_CHLGU|nr:hypothetical protein DV515_00017177 [Chloebia gouldiae]
MHSSSYGYNYNGMDLSINRSASSSHFGAVGESSRGFPSPAQESRFRQASSCSLSSPDSLPCSNSESHGGKPAPSPSEQAPAASSTNTNFTELDETSASSGADEGTPISGSIPRAQAEPIATSTAATEGQAPQIFPWMRKLHISHGTAPSFSVVVLVYFLPHTPHPTAAASLFFSALPWRLGAGGVSGDDFILRLFPRALSTARAVGEGNLKIEAGGVFLGVGIDPKMASEAQMGLAAPSCSDFLGFFPDDLPLTNPQNRREPRGREEPPPASPSALNPRFSAAEKSGTETCREPREHPGGSGGEK